MRSVWNVKLYYVSTKTGYKVKLEGDTKPGSPWVFSEGHGKTPFEALDKAMSQMSAFDQAQLISFIHGDKR